LVSHSSTIAMMHGPINIRFHTSVYYSISSHKMQSIVKFLQYINSIRFPMLLTKPKLNFVACFQESYMVSHPWTIKYENWYN